MRNVGLICLKLRRSCAREQNSAPDVGPRTEMFYICFALSAQDMNFVYAARSVRQHRAVNQSDKALRRKRVPTAAHHSAVFRQDWESTSNFSFGSVAKGDSTNSQRLLSSCMCLTLCHCYKNLTSIQLKILDATHTFLLNFKWIQEGVLCSAFSYPGVLFW